MDPAEPGAVAVIVNCAVPFAALAARPLLSVTEHDSSAAADEGSVPQFTLDTPVPALTAVAMTPVGSWSLTVADVPEVVPPLFPRPIV